MDYDFSCWVIKYNGALVFNRIYQNGSISNSDGCVIPLLWDHRHDDPDMVLGRAVLENRDGGVYCYCTLYDTPLKTTTLDLIKDRGSVAISPFVNQIKCDGNTIVSGLIGEVSLVYARIDPDEDYYPVLKSEESVDCNDCAWININEEYQEEYLLNTGQRIAHRCIYYSKYLKHGVANNLDNEGIMPCEECEADNYKMFKEEAE